MIGTFEVGYQHRFRPWHAGSLSPGAMFGALHAFGGLKRGVNCDGCRSVKLDADLDGYYLSPFLRLTFGSVGEMALIVRSQWFITGDVRQATVLGFEYGLP
jgi:hypothetical protein